MLKKGIATISSFILVFSSVTPLSINATNTNTLANISTTNTNTALTATSTITTNSTLSAISTEIYNSSVATISTSTTNKALATVNTATPKTSSATISTSTTNSSLTATTTNSLLAASNTATITNSTVNIKDFGAHSIDEAGYTNFDSSQAIKNTIQYAKNNGCSKIDFGSGRYYAKDINLESNITYYSTQGAELISSPDIKVWQSIFTATNKTNMSIKGLAFNGNWDVVPGSGQSGSLLIALTTCNNVLIDSCCLFHNKYLGILMQNNCNYITIKNNRIIDTDCGIISAHGASNNITIDNNTIFGDQIQYSEPIAIFNSNENGLAHDITITNNIVYGKKNASGIFITNSEQVLVKGNTVFGCDQGIGVGISSDRKDSNVIVSKNITITENNILNCISGGITAELSDSSIYKNNIINIVGSGITLTSIHKNTFSTNTKIYNNNVTNINSKIGNNEPAIRLQKSLNCTIENNIVSDTRATVNTCWAIQVQGQECNNNIIQNNTSLGSLVKWGYSIYVQNARNTTIRDNKGTILDQGTGTILLNNYK